MQPGIHWGGDYSRFSFNEAKRYVALLKVQGKSVLDDDFNLMQDILLTVLRRFILHSVGNGSPNNGFKVVATGAANDFTLKGGDGSADGAGHLYVAGLIIPQLADTTYNAQEVSAPALTTPGANRTDQVYVDVWLDEVGPADDPDMNDPGLSVETGRRLKLFAQVRVAEGGATPADYTDANGLAHHTYQLATLNRTATANITAPMVADRRARIPAAFDRVTTVTAANSPYVLAAIDAGLVLVNASAGPVAITLPPATARAGLRCTFARLDTSVNTATLSTPAGHFIEGASPLSLPHHARLPLIADGVNQWYRGGELPATDAEVWAGEARNRVVTPAGLASFEKQLGTSGFQKLPGGLILQWMRPSPNFAGGATPTVDWPIPFPNECLFAMAGDFGSTNFNVTTQSATTTGVTLRSSSPQSPPGGGDLVSVWGIGI